MNYQITFSEFLCESKENNCKNNIMMTCSFDKIEILLYQVGKIRNSYTSLQKVIVLKHSLWRRLLLNQANRANMWFINNWKVSYIGQGSCTVIDDLQNEKTTANNTQ